jgi:stearoyl-CoA desaturase (delta-9 desaturase)
MNILIAILIDLHIGMVITSLYFHRGVAHGQLIFSPVLEHIFRFFGWINGWDWPNLHQSYVAQHRKHHLYSDSEKDPHSPYNRGIQGILDFKHTDPSRGYYLSPEEVEFYAPDIKTPNDWIQRNIYDRARVKLCLLDWNQKSHWFDLNLSFVFLFLIFWPFVGAIGAVGLVFFHHLILQRYIVVFVNNYMFHKGIFGFNYVKEHVGQDKSRILFPIGILFAGEELHVNHHNQPWNPKLKRRWFEFDIGWIYIQLFAFFKLLKIKSK